MAYRDAMTATGFDTLAYARRLKEAGVDEAQAEAHAEAVRDAMTEGVATKADLGTAIAELKADMLKVAVGIVLANAGVIVAAVVALVNLLP